MGSLVNLGSSHGSLGLCFIDHIIILFAFFLQFFPSAEEAIDYFNQKRCVDGKALVLPSQIVSHFHLWNAFYLLQSFM